MGWSSSESWSLLHVQGKDQDEQGCEASVRNGTNKQHGCRAGAAQAQPGNIDALLGGTSLVGRDLIRLGRSRWLPAGATSSTRRRCSCGRARHCLLLCCCSLLRDLPPRKRLGTERERLQVQGGLAAAAGAAALRCRDGCLLDALQPLLGLCQAGGQAGRLGPIERPVLDSSWQRCAARGGHGSCASTLCSFASWTQHLAGRSSRSSSGGSGVLLAAPRLLLPAQLLLTFRLKLLFPAAITAGMSSKCSGSACVRVRDRQCTGQEGMP